MGILGNPCPSDICNYGNQDNTPPHASAGQDQTVEDSDNSGNEAVTLDGSGSYDSDGSISSYAWKENGQSIASGVNPTVTLPIGAHTIELTVTDNNGAADQDTVQITVSPPEADNSPPVISNVEVTGTSSQTATITWKTDELADSQVKYGLDNNYGATTTLDSVATTTHQVVIKSLTPGTTYHFAVLSRDQAGNLATSPDQVFTTKKETIVSLTPASSEVEQNKEFSLDVNVSNVENLSGVAFDLNFDPSLVSFASTSEGTFLSQGCNTSLQAGLGPNNNGKLIVGITRLGSSCGGVSGSGSLMTLNFKSLTKAGTNNFSFSNNDLFNSSAPPDNHIPSVQWMPSSVTEPVTSYPISLNAGWNLISLPLIPNDSSIADVLSGISSNVDIVKYYDTGAGAWLSYVPSGNTGSLDTMEDGKGYWVFMKNADTLTINGQERPGPAESLPEYHVYAGWNLIGFKSVDIMKSSTYLYGVDYTRVYNGKYSLVADRNENTDNNMIPGAGYWVYAVAEGSFSPPLGQ